MTEDLTEAEILERLAVIRKVLGIIFKTRRELHDQLKIINANKTRH